MRVANLEADLQTTPDQLGLEGGLKTGWFRIFRHMLPHKVRRLLLEHDHFEEMQLQLQQLRTEATSRLQQIGAAVVKDAPAFPRAIFEATQTSKIAIVDIGAQDLVWEEHIYAPLQRAGATSVVGFEPLPDTGSIPRRIDPSVVMLNHFVGAGGPAVFHVTQFDPASSLFDPNTEFLSQFQDLPIMCKTVETIEVQTTRLDDIAEIGFCDFLKIDVQGGELDVLKGAERVLDKIITIHCEVEFAAVYRDQPLFSEIDTHLRTAGFELINLINAGYNRYQALPGHVASGSRLLWAEAIYCKLPLLLKRQGAEKLLKAAYIAHVNYGMYDLAAHYLAEHDKLTGASTLAQYSTEQAGWVDRTFRRN
jgi:FkbM family methyltransferase